jgi:hypothetical protein
LVLLRLSRATHATLWGALEGWKNGRVGRLRRLVPLEGRLSQRQDERSKAE